MNCLFHLSTEACYVLVPCYVIISNVISGQTVVHRPTVARSAACLAATDHAEPETIFSHSAVDYCAQASRGSRLLGQIRRTLFSSA